MTDPTKSNITDAAFSDLQSMLAGNDQLAKEPGVVYALAQAQASPQEAGAVNEFLKALELNKQVQILRSTGQKVTFTTDEQQSLAALGVPYSDVELTQQNALAAQATMLEQQSNGLLTAKRENGKFVTDENGNPVAVSTGTGAQNIARATATAKQLGVSFQAPTVHRGFWGNIGHFINQEIVKPVWRDAVKPTLTVLSKPVNTLFTGVGILGQVLNEDDIRSGHITSPGDVLSGMAQDMRNSGYNPDNPFSVLAYVSSGHAIGQTKDLNDSYGEDKVNEAEQYLNDPEGALKAIENDPKSYVTDSSGEKQLTKEAQDKLNYYNSDQFKSLIGQLQTRQLSPGIQIANGLGLDPVKHPTLFNVTSAVTDIALSFALDPLLVAGRLTKAAKLAQVGRSGLDSERAAAVLDPAGQAARAAALDPSTLEGARSLTMANTTKQGVYSAALQRRTQQFLDLTHAEAVARAAGETATANGLDAQLAAQFPEWSPLRGDVLGTQQIKAWDVKVVNGVPRAAPVLGQGEPIRTLPEFASYIASKNAMVRLAGSKAAVQSPYLPGAVSSFGARYLKGKFANFMTANATRISAKRDAAILTRAEADPALARDLETEGVIERILPEADDAQNFLSGYDIANKSAQIKADLQVLIDGLSQHVLTDADAVALQERLQTTLAHWTEPSDTQLADIEADIARGQSLLGYEDHREALVRTGQAEADANAPVLPSQARGQGVPYRVTAKGRGWADFNIRKTANPLGGRAIGWAMPAAVAARARLAATRLSTLLPRNTEFDIEDAATADKVFSYARIYANRADASMLRAQFITGDAGQRKAILDALMDQTFHAAGLATTESGQELMAASRTAEQRYSTAGPKLLRNGREIALHSGQTRQVWRLPDFQEIHRAAAKVGLWDATIGRALTSGSADRMMSALKLGWLGRPATVTRNQLEGWLRMTTDGQLGDALKARAYATMRNEEAWKLGIGTADLDAYKAAIEAGDTKAAKALEGKAIVAHHRATEAGDEATAKTIAQASLLTGQQLGRSGFGDRLANFAPFALAGRAYRRLYNRDMTEGELSALETLGSQELAEFMRGYTRQIFEGDLGLYRAAQESKEIAASGFGPSYLRYGIERAKKKGPKAAKTTARWTQQDTDGTVGADRYAHALAQRVNDSPDVAVAALNLIEHPEEHDISDVVAALDALDTTKARLLGWGHDFWPNGAGEAVPVSTLTGDEKAKAIAAGKAQMAREVVEDYRALVTGQNGEVQTAIGDYIRENRVAPDSEWIAGNLRNLNRPAFVLAPEVVAMAPGGAKGTIDSLLDLAGAGYAWMVERPLQRTTTAPAFLANYAVARHALNPTVDRLVESGLTRTAAENLAKEVSVKNAWIKAETLIDDPGQKTQFDVVARNVFPFARATQAMIRRWGGGLWRDPLAARKLQLAYEGAVQSGFIYYNQYGEPTFLYPASGVLNMVMQELSKLPGPLHGIAQFPIAGDMTGGVLMAVPGAENPLRMSASPFIMLPLREVKRFLPGNEQVMFDEIDAALNGPVGQGETFGQFEPTVAKSFYRAMNPDERSAAYASAMAGAIANLAATGQIPTADASPHEVQSFIKNLQTQVRSQLFVRAALGLVAPAAPSNPTEAVAGTGSDYAFQLEGVKNLSDEYKHILNDVGGDVGRANAIWTALHPDEVVYDMNGAIRSAKLASSAYEEGQSQGTTNKATIPDTEDALRWMTQNENFIKKYPRVAAYFLPEADTNEPFNDQAYRLQMELGLRQRKTPEEFLNDLYVRNAESVYYPVVDQVNAQIAQLKQQGNASKASALNDELQAWKAQFKTTNAAFGAKEASYASSASGALGQLKDLQSMVQNGDVPDGMGPEVALLLKNYDGYENFINTHRGSDSADTAAREAALQAFETWAASHLQDNLRDLYNGVFRGLNSNLSALAKSGPQQ
jgi:hypothetical protein